MNLFFYPSGLSFPHAICLVCPSSDTQIFKSCLAFDYQMEEDYSWIVLIMSDKLIHTKMILKICHNFLIVVYKSMCYPSTCQELLSSGSKINNIFFDPVYVIGFTSVRKTWTNCLNHSFHSVFIVTRFAFLFSPSCEWDRKFGMWKVKWATFSVFWITEVMCSWRALEQGI